MDITGVALTVNEKYNKSDIEKAVDEFNEKLDAAPVFGVCSGEPELTLKNVSHKIKSLSLIGDQVVATIEILDTPEGKKLKQLVNDGVMLKEKGIIDSTKDIMKLGTVMRGTIDKDGIVSVLSIERADIQFNVCPIERDTHSKD
jgi:hypothetical protein